MDMEWFGGMEWFILVMTGIVWFAWTNARLGYIEEVIKSEHPEHRARITRSSGVMNWVLAAGGVAAFASGKLHYLLPYLH
jgi:hypothetical protein